MKLTPSEIVAVAWMVSGAIVVVVALLLVASYLIVGHLNSGGF